MEREVKESRLFKKEILPAIIFALAASTVPFALGFNQYYTLLAAQIMIFATMVVAWNVIGGYAGQLDLSAFAYVGLGGIIAGILLNNYGITPWIGMFVGAGVAMGLAAIIGYPAFRFGIKEVWYALMTASLVVILNNLSKLIIGPFDYYLPPVEGWYYLKFARWDYMYYITVVITAFAIFINLRISHSKTGYYLRAIREDELAAEALGIDVRKYKMKALLTYAGILGFIGYIYVVLVRTYSYHIFDSANSLTVAIMGIVGGLGSVSGALTSAVILKAVGEYLRGTFGATIPGLHLLIYGILLIIVGIFKPDGFAGIIDWFKRKIIPALKR